MYYSLKTKKEEHTLEPRLDGHFYYAVYDLMKNQKGDKQLIMKADVTKFIFDKQTELKAKFEKVYLESEPKEKGDKTFIVADKEDKPKRKPKVAFYNGTIDEIPKQILDQLPDEIKKIITEDDDESISIGKHTQVRTNFTSKEDYEKSKDKFVISCELDLKTGKTVFNVSYCPPSDKDETADHAWKFIHSFVPTLVEALPELADNIINTGASSALNVPLEKAHEKYKQTELRGNVRLGILKAIKEGITTENYNPKA